MKKIILSSTALLCVAATILGGYYYFANDTVQKAEVPQIQQDEINEEGKASYPERAEQWRVDAWRDEMGVVASDGLAKAVAQRDAYFVAHNPPDGFGDKGIALMNWLPVGPANIGGRTRPIVFDPNDPTGNTMWAGAVSGGVWKSTNGGTSWVAMNGGLQNFAVNCMIIDRVPNGTRNSTLWVGTGEGLSTVGLSGGGLFKSTDGGLSWERKENTYVNKWQYIDSLAITRFGGNTIMLAGVEGHPDFPNIRGIMRSINDGESWSPVYPAFTSKSIVVDPSNPGNIVAEVVGPGTIFNSSPINRVIYSADAGLNWTISKRTANATPNPTADPNFETGSRDQIVKLAYHKSNPNIVYAHEMGTEPAFIGQTSKSTDGGRTFSSYNLGGAHYFSRYVSPFWVSPLNDKAIISGGLQFQRSTNGGQTFSFIHNFNVFDPHLDAQNAVSDPNYGVGTNRRFYVTTDGGINRTEDITAPTVTWVDRNRTFQTTQFYSAAGARRDDGRDLICGGTQDTGILRMILGNPDAVRVVDGDAGCSAVDDEYSYWTGQGGGELRRSPNDPLQPTPGPAPQIINGISDYLINPSPDTWAAPMAIDPTDGNRFFLGRNSVWRTDNVQEPHPNHVEWTEIRQNPILTPSPSGTQSPVPYKQVAITAMDLFERDSDSLWVAESLVRPPLPQSAGGTTL